jgi:hypothetical protein
MQEGEKFVVSLFVKLGYLTGAHQFAPNPREMRAARLLSEQKNGN